MGTKVLGMPLGEPVHVPTCDSMFESKTCLQEEPPAELVDTINSMFNVKNTATAEDMRSTSHAVHLSADDCPSWMSGCYARLLVYDGRLVAVDVSTKGRTVDQAVARDLREKYGPPTLIKHIVVTPRVGNQFNANNQYRGRRHRHRNRNCLSAPHGETNPETQAEAIVRFSPEVHSRWCFQCDNDCFVAACPCTKSMHSQNPLFEHQRLTHPASHADQSRRWLVPFLTRPNPRPGRECRVDGHHRGNAPAACHTQPAALWS